MSVNAMTWVLGTRREGRWIEPPLQTPGSGARVVLLVLADFADENGECWPSISTIAAAADMSDSQARRHIRSLTDAGLIRVADQAAPDSRIASNHRPNTYRLGVAWMQPLAGDRGRVDAHQGSRPCADRGGIHATQTTNRTTKEPSGGTDAQSRRDWADIDDTLSLLDDYTTRPATPVPAEARQRLAAARRRDEAS